MISVTQADNPREITVQHVPKAVTWELGDTGSRTHYRYASPYVLTAADDLPVAENARLVELLTRLTVTVQEYLELPGIARGMAEVEQPEYRLESIDADTRRIYARMNRVHDHEHDVFVEYVDDPLFS